MIINQTEMKLLKLSILLICMATCQIYAQDATPASGKTISGTNGSITYSVGQIVYTTNNGPNGSVSQGVIQPFEISTVTGYKHNDIDLKWSVYPNLTTDNLTLSMDKVSNATYQLFDASEQLVANERIEYSETSISMSGLASGAYILVVSNTKEAKTFKIIKK